MITHEEIKDRVIRCYRKHSYLDSISRFRILDYVQQQKKKDKLLWLYRELSKLEDVGIFYVEDFIQDEEDRASYIDKIIVEIIAIEEELK
jgi:hypothetical protein